MHSHASLKRDNSSKPEIKIIKDEVSIAEDFINKKIQDDKIKREEEKKKKEEFSAQKKVLEEGREKGEREQLEKLKEEFKHKINLKEDTYSQDPPTEKKS